MRIDHVIMAATDLDAAAARLAEEYGLVATSGGRHEGMGTHNRIVPLGGGYLELLAVADPWEAAGSPLGRAVSERIAARGDGLLGWAVAVDDVTAVAERVGSEISTISRAGLTARLAGVAEAMAEPCLPFFIERDPGVPDPGAERSGEAIARGEASGRGRKGSARGSGEAGGISWIEVAGEPERLGEWLGGLGSLPLRITGGPPAVLAVGIGERELR